MRTAAILPIKRFERAKQRLGASVADPLRRDLAEAMVGDVLTALAATPAIERIFVVTREPLAAEAAAARGAVAIPDEREAGQSEAVAVGIARAVAEGFERVLCVPGDCPALDAAELQALLTDETLGVVIVPDRHGTGTNGLLMAPPEAITPSFGADSCARHQQLAAAAGVACGLSRPSSLLLDVDTGEDLTALGRRLAGARDGAERTRVALAEAVELDLLPASHAA